MLWLLCPFLIICSGSRLQWHRHSQQELSLALDLTLFSLNHATQNFQYWWCLMVFKLKVRLLGLCDLYPGSHPWSRLTTRLGLTASLDQPAFFPPGNMPQPQIMGHVRCPVPLTACSQPLILTEHPLVNSNRLQFIRRSCSCQLLAFCATQQGVYSAWFG